jgi:hypothetical protein
MQHIVHRKHQKYATNPDNFIQLDFLLDRVRRQTRAEVAEDRSCSLAAHPPDSADAVADDSACFPSCIHGSDGDALRFSSSQEVSDYLPQPYKGSVWEELDDPGLDPGGEKPGDSMDM